MSAKLRQEIYHCLGYLMISLISAIYASAKYQDFLMVQGKVHSFPTDDINLQGLIKIALSNFILPFISVFLSLSVVKVIIFYFFAFLKSYFTSPEKCK